MLLKGLKLSRVWQLMFKQLSVLGSSNRMGNRKVIQVNHLFLPEVSTLGYIVPGYKELPHGCVRRIATGVKGLYRYILFKICVDIFPSYMYMPHIFACCPRKPEKYVGSFSTVVMMVVRHHVDTGNQNWIFWKSQQYS